MPWRTDCAQNIRQKERKKMTAITLILPLQNCAPVFELWLSLLDIGEVP